jgi:hypothetical protein
MRLGMTTRGWGPTRSWRCAADGGKIRISRRAPDGFAIFATVQGVNIAVVGMRDGRRAMFASYTGANFAQPPDRAHERDLCPRGATRLSRREYRRMSAPQNMTSDCPLNLCGLHIIASVVHVSRF